MLGGTVKRSRASWPLSVVVSVVIAVGVVAGPGVSAPVVAAEDPAVALRKNVVAALRTSTAGARSVVVHVEGVGTVVDLDGDRMLAPASTQKMFTAGAAAVQLDTAWRLRTEVRASLPAVGGVLPGDLVLVAGGDPTLRGSDLQRLAAEVAASGVTQVEGALYADDTRFDRAREAAGWKPGWVPRESGPLSAFAVDRNAWRRDAAFLADPARANAERFRQVLAAAGVTVQGETVVGRPEMELPYLLAAHESAPLGSIAGAMLKTSDNFVAEMLLKELGAASGTGSSAGGVDALGRVADALGVPRSEAADGSGLSSFDRSSARREVAWLIALDRVPAGAVLRSGFPVSCTDGTLRTRFCRTPAAGRVVAKTGTLNYVTTLSGYTTTAAGHRAWFSVLLSGTRSLTKARAAIDRAVTAVVTSGV